MDTLTPSPKGPRDEFRAGHGPERANLHLHPALAEPPRFLNGFLKLVHLLRIDLMDDGSPGIELQERDDPLWEVRFRAALLHLSRLFTGAQLRTLLSPGTSHELFGAKAAPLRSAETPDRLPGSLHGILGQYFVDLEPAPIEVIPDTLDIGSNHLGSLSPIQGALLPATFRGRDGEGGVRGSHGVIFVPNYCALPAHVLPRSKEDQEIVVLIGARESFGAAYDRSYDVLVIDRMRTKSSETDRGRSLSNPPDP